MRSEHTKHLWTLRRAIFPRFLYEIVAHDVIKTNFKANVISWVY